MISTGNPKLDQIVNIGKELFWKFGIKRVTVEEICKESEVSKMTFYKYFENKFELVKFIIEHITNDAINEYQEIMKKDLPFKEKVTLTLDMKLRSSEAMSEEFYNDYVRHATPEMVDFLHQQMNKTLTLIMQDYMEAQKRGDIRRDINPQFILYFLNHMLDMIKDPKLEHMYSKPQDLIMEMTNFFFYGILPRDGE